jgi:hypothetical protein
MQKRGDDKLKDDAPNLDDPNDYAEGMSNEEFNAALVRLYDIVMSKDPVERTYDSLNMKG